MRNRRIVINPRFKKSLVDIAKPKVSLIETEVYHRNKGKIKKTIMSVTDNHEVIHGEHAVQKQIPGYLHRHTNDIDIKSPTPRRDAVEAEMALDRKFGGDHFHIKNPMFGLYRVVSNATGEVHADYSLKDEKIPTKKISGKYYATLGYMKKKLKGTVAEPLAMHRHGKDMDTLNRIKIAEKKKGGKR